MTKAAKMEKMATSRGADWKQPIGRLNIP